MEEDGEEQAFATRVSGCMLANSIEGEGEEEADEKEEEEGERRRRPVPRETSSGDWTSICHDL